MNMKKKKTHQQIGRGWPGVESVLQWKPERCRHLSGWSRKPSTGRTWTDENCKGQTKHLGPAGKSLRVSFTQNPPHLCRLCTEATAEQGRVKLRAEVIITYHTHDEPMAWPDGLPEWRSREGGGGLVQSTVPHGMITSSSTWLKTLRLTRPCFTCNVKLLQVWVRSIVVEVCFLNPPVRPLPRENPKKQRNKQHC